VGFVAFTDKDLDNLQIGGTIYWGPPPEITYNQAIETWELGFQTGNIWGKRENSWKRRLTGDFGRNLGTLFFFDN
jgi:hypothetical protein